jgi:hypothetical protein
VCLNSFKPWKFFFSQYRRVFSLQTCVSVYQLYIELLQSSTAFRGKVPESIYSASDGQGGRGVKYGPCGDRLDCLLLEEIGGQEGPLGGAHACHSTCVAHVARALCDLPSDSFISRRSLQLRNCWLICLIGGMMTGRRDAIGPTLRNSPEGKAKNGCCLFVQIIILNIRLRLKSA